jgi:hypothetical protein
MIAETILVARDENERILPDLTPSSETINFLNRILPGTHDCPNVSQGLREGFFKQEYESE